MPKAAPVTPNRLISHRLAVNAITQVMIEFSKFSRGFCTMITVSARLTNAFVAQAMRHDAEPHAALSKRGTVDSENDGTGQNHDGDERQQNPEHPLRDARKCGRGVLLVAVDRQAGHDRCEDGIESLIHFAQTARDFDGGAVNSESGERHAGRPPDKASEHDDVETNNDGVEEVVGADWRGVGEEATGFRAVGKRGGSRRRRPKERGGQEESDDPRCSHPDDDSDLRREGREPKPKRRQERERGHDRFR